MQKHSEERNLSLKFNNESIYIANKLKMGTLLSDFIMSVFGVLTLKAVGPGGPASPCLKQESKQISNLFSYTYLTSRHFRGFAEVNSV